MAKHIRPSNRRTDFALVSEKLLAWFGRKGRDLPWRRTRDPYAILVSEFMLQQTQVETVLRYYEPWLARFPDFVSLAHASEPAVLLRWQGLGYYARARNLRAAAKLVVEQFNGRLPADPLAIAQLPGVGRYIGGAVASFAFDLPAPAVDANIARVLARLTNLQVPIDSAAGGEKLWSLAAALVPPTGARIHNSALMDLGAMICLPRRPLCELCPIRSFCRSDDPAALPLKRAKPSTVVRIEHHAFTRKQNRILLEQSRERWRGLWILPRLERKPKRSPLLQLEFPFTHHRITLAVFAKAPTRMPAEHERWFAVRSLARLPMPSPHRRAVTQLLQRSS